MIFSGERLIPQNSPKRLLDDHLARYDFACNFVKNKTVLDIACGVGYGARILSEAGAQRVFAVDICAEAIDYANEHYATTNIEFILDDIKSYRTKQKFDVITCFETIEHIKDYNSALRTLSNLLDDFGVLLISTPNRCITSPNSKSLNDPPKNKFHHFEFSIQEFIKILQDHGFKIDNKKIYGQRQQRVFSTKSINHLYNKIFDPKNNCSAALSPAISLVSRYFTVITGK